MDVIYNFLADYVNVLLWDYFLTYGLLFAGLYFSIRFGFPQVTRMWEALKQVFGKLFKKDVSQEGSMSSFQALATAVAAQVGTGNVAGVATAILGGGPGAIFWMWVSAFLGMGTIFNEAILAQVYRMRDRNKGDLVGGPAYYLSKGVGSNALAKFFSVSLIVALGFIGNMVQSNSIASAVTTAFAIPEWVTGLVIALAAILIFAGGMKRIATFAEFVVPIMALVYIVASLVILFLFRDNVIPAFKMIFVGAFTPQAAIGGIAGASVRAAVQKGVARGLFSNEAGMGSTPHAHAVAHVDHPVQQGLAAMVGVFIDTVIVCSATALIILVTESYLDPALKGAQVTQAAFSIAFGGGGSVLLAICLTFFAFTTIIGWYYFGESNIKYLFGTKGVLPYQILVAIFIFLGALQEVDIVCMLADTFNALMVIPNLFGLFFLSNQVKGILEDYDRCKLEGRIFYDYDVK